MTAALVPVLAPPEELHDNSLIEFEAEVTPHVASQGPGVVFDLNNVRFISSTGLGYFVKLGMRLDAKGRRIALAAPNRKMTKLLRLTGLDGLIPQFRTVAEAQEYVAAAKAQT